MVSRGYQWPLTLTRDNAVMANVVPDRGEFHVASIRPVKENRGMTACERFLSFVGMERHSPETFEKSHPGDVLCEDCQNRIDETLRDCFGRDFDAALNRLRVQFYKTVAGENPQLNIGNVSILLVVGFSEVDVEPCFGGLKGKPVVWRWDSVDFDRGYEEFALEAMTEYRKLCLT